MSTVISSKEMFPVFEAIPTTIEEVKTLVDSFIAKFLEIADFLEIKSEEEHAYGKFVYIGEKGKDFPIMVIGNSNNASYHLAGILVNRIGTDGKVVSGKVNVTGFYVENYISIPFNTKCAVIMKYLKTSKGMCCKFSLADQEPKEGTLILSPMITDEVEGECINHWVVNNQLAHCSFVPHGTFYSLSETIPDLNYTIVPSTKRALLDVYYRYNHSFPYLKFASWNPAIFEKYEINGKKYAVAHSDGKRWAILMEIA